MISATIAREGQRGGAFRVPDPQAIIQVIMSTGRHYQLAQTTPVLGKHTN